jgi:dihydrofolate synthase/folylpolyglutamate synthase
MADVASPGRLQVIDVDPLVILDGAHNPHGAKAVAQTLAKNFGSPELAAVVSMVEEKDSSAFIEELKGAVSHFVVTQSASDRAKPAGALAEEIQDKVGSAKVSVQPNVLSAIEQAKSLVKNTKNGAVLITGSLTLVGEVLANKQREAELDG